MIIIIIPRIIRIIIIALLIFITSLVVCGDHVRYPYKKYYGLPAKCGNNPKFNQCENDAKKTWGIGIDDYFIRNQAFCCFVWEQLDCELEHTGKCAILVREYDEFSGDLVSEEHVPFSKVLFKSTMDQFKPFCGPYQRGSYRCYFTTQRIIFITSMLALGFILALLSFSVPTANWPLLIVTSTAGSCLYGYISDIIQNPAPHMDPVWREES